MKKTVVLSIALGLTGTAAMAANPVVVNAGGGGDFTSIQAAISSWCVGGSNAGETAPFVINVVPSAGPYDEAINLEQGVVGVGNIVGNLVIQSSVPGTKAVLKLRVHPSSVAGTDDGLMIMQDAHNVTFRDLVFTRSLTSQPIDEIVRVDESGPNATLNTMAWYNCVFTEADVAGNPMVTDKAGALAPPPARGGIALSTNARLLQVWGDAGESNNIIVDNCVFYGSSNINCIIRLEGTLGTGVGNGYPETLTMVDCLSSYAFADCFNIGGINQNMTMNITGTDHTAGPLSATAAVVPAHMGAAANNGHCFSISASGNALLDNTHNINFNGVIAYAPGDASGAAGSSSTAARGITGGSSRINISDTIINVPFYGVVDITRAPTVWNRVTVHTQNAAYFAGGTTAANGSLTMNDCIISGPGTKIAGTMPAGGIIVQNSALVQAGPDAITAVGGGASVTQTNVITSDPQYVAKDGTLATFMDVANSAYATANSTGFALAGGANYVGAVQSSVNEWSLYQ